MSKPFLANLNICGEFLKIKWDFENWRNNS